MNAARENRSVSSLHVLVAEDSLVHQRLMVHLLENQGHTVSVVNNGKDAVSALQSRTFDVVLMDIEMPQMDGLTATRMIRAREALGPKHLPIVAVTSRNNRRECLDAGMDAYLAKPLTRDGLAKTIEMVTAKAAA